MRPQRVPEQPEPAISQIRYAYGCGTGYGYAYETHTHSQMGVFEAKLTSAYHEWVKNARRSGKSIYHFSLICLCVCVCAWVCVRGCACVTGESLAKTLDNTYLHARKTSTNKCGQVPKWEECNAAHSVANALVMQPSRKVLRSIRGRYVINM